MKPYEYSIYIATTPESLWDALTSGESTRKYFFGMKVDSDWEEGSKVAFMRKNGEVDVEGEVVLAKPYEELTFTWDHPDVEREEPSVVTYKMKKLAEVVKLTVVHDNVVADDYCDEEDTFRGLNNGWPAILSNLKSYLETGNVLSPMNS
ncbi:SRPBCC family protein [Alkalihalobacillus macyae]|uniref:SRPBCC family protein n=1 Tax=Guptibacillus hwajinpoensis TaxID=208199 RepID=UPI00273B2688|nr:SRPBCC family protein [Alkalihalobacillus macyae]MDP4551503.1 SRPBCC family protein [Alkalihalobacillus macyae]